MTPRLPYDERQIFALVQQIQGAPLYPYGWGLFNESVMALTNSRLANLYVFDRHQGVARFVDFRGASGEMRHAYETHYAARSLTQQTTDTLSPGKAYLESMADPQALRQCEAYNELFVPFYINHLAIISLQNDGHYKTAFSLRRGPREGAYDDNSVRLLRFLFPFLRQSIALQGRLELLKGFENALHQSLNLLGHGALLLDDQGHLIFANRLAEGMLADQDGLSLDRLGRCLAASKEANGNLSKLIAKCARAGLGLGLHPGGAMAVPRPSGRRPYGVHIFPIPMETPLFDTQRPAVGLFITDPERNHRPPHELLGALYGLSPAEQRLAALLMEGLALKDCAEHLEITQNTARSYMKTVFSKTGVSRQADLIRLLLSSTPPMGR